MEIWISIRAQVVSIREDDMISVLYSNCSGKEDSLVLGVERAPGTH